LLSWSERTALQREDWHELRSFGVIVQSSPQKWIVVPTIGIYRHDRLTEAGRGNRIREGGFGRTLFVEIEFNLDISYFVLAFKVEGKLQDIWRMSRATFLSINDFLNVGGGSSWTAVSAFACLSIRFSIASESSSRLLSTALKIQYRICINH
jgi:hypothetical protein